MRKNIWKRIVATSLFVLVLVAATAESADPQKFRFRDLFKKTESASGKAASSKADTSKDAKDSKEQAKPATETADKADAEKKESTASGSSGDATVSSATKAASSALKEMSSSDKLKSLTDQLGAAESDPDALIRSARARFLKMKEKEMASDKKKASSTVKTASTPKAEEKPPATSGKANKAKTGTAAVATAPVQVTEKVVTTAAAPKTSRVVDTSRPPSLASVTAVAAAPVTTSREVPPENLQTAFAASDVPAPKLLVPRKQKKKKKAPSVMEITSDEVEMDNEKHTTTFIGNVNLSHPTFHMKSDRLVIFMHEEDVESDAPFKQAIATGARVIVERVNDKGDKDVGQSRKVIYDGLTGDLKLIGGPAQLQSGKSLVQTRSEEASITLKKDGNHSVEDKSVGGGGPRLLFPSMEKKEEKQGMVPH